MRPPGGGGAEVRTEKPAGSPPSIRSVVGTLVLAVAFLASRLPLLSLGYGSDERAWRSVVTALHMRAVGHYIPSRFPGFPLHDGLTTLLVPLGPRALLLASIAAQLAAAVYFHRIARALRLPAPTAVTVAFAFSAALWVTTTQNVDFPFELALLLATYDALLSGRPVVAGLVLGLATGFRPSAALVAMPALGFIAADARPGASRVTSAVGFMVAFVVPVAAAFLPVLASTELRNAAGQVALHAGHRIDRIWAIRGGAVFLFGKVGLVTIALATLIGAVGRLRGRRPSPAGPDAALLFELASCLLLGGLYLLVPYDPVYLLPLLPLLLLAAGRVMPGPMVPIVAIAIASEALVLPLLDTKRVVPGRLFQEIELRRAQVREAHAFMELRPDAPTIYVLGRPALMRLLVLDPSLQRTEAGWAAFGETGVGLWTRDLRLGFAAYLDESQRADLRRRGYQVVGPDI